MIGEPKERRTYEVEGRSYISRPFIQGWKCMLDRLPHLKVMEPVWGIACSKEVYIG